MADSWSRWMWAGSLGVLLSACMPVNDGMLSPPPPTLPQFSTPEPDTSTPRPETPDEGTGSLPPGPTPTPGLTPTLPPTEGEVTQTTTATPPLVTPTFEPSTPTQVPPTSTEEPLHDLDGDGYYSNAPEGVPVDCNDNSPSIYPGAIEPCYALVDVNCDGVVPGGTQHNWYTDGDGDDFGDDEIATTNCDSTPPEGTSATSNDCDDTRSDVYPGAPELCDLGVDNDCNAATDELTMPDGDGDGWSSCGGDCNDEDADIGPDVLDVCNAGIDDDCNPATSELLDGDGDGYSACEGDCNDRAYVASPYHTYEILDGVDTDCDTDTEEPFTTVGRAGVTVRGVDADSLFGGILVGPGDLDGDDYADFVVSSALYSETGITAGAVTFFYGQGGRTGVTTDDFHRTLYYGDGIDSVGCSVGTADFNGDGIGDVIVGATVASRAYIRYGGTRSPSGEFEATDMGAFVKSTGQGSTGLGFSVGGADLDDDGFDEIVIGNNVSERVFFHFGSAVPLSGEVDIKGSPTLDLDTVNGNLGNTLVNIGDLDGDGIDDVALGAPVANVNAGGGLRNDAGLVVIIYGGEREDFISGSPRLTFLLGATETDNFGSALGAPGDINGDGLADLLVGANGVRRGSESGPVMGAVFLVPGLQGGYGAEYDGAGLKTRFLTSQDDTMMANLATVSGVGDINQDGLADFSLGLPNYVHNTTQAGVVAVFLGRRTGFSGNIDVEAADLIFTGARSGDQLSSAGNVGDMDYDGFNDLLLGAWRASATPTDHPEGAAYLFYGFPTEP